MQSTGCLSSVYQSPNFSRNVLIGAAVTLTVAAVALVILYSIADKRSTEITLNNRNAIAGNARQLGEIEGDCLVHQQNLAYLKMCNPSETLPGAIARCEDHLARLHASLLLAQQQLSATQSLLTAASFWKRISHIAAGASLGCVALMGVSSLAAVRQHNKNSPSSKKSNYAVALIAISLVSIAIVSVIVARAHSAKNAWSLDRHKQTEVITDTNESMHKWINWGKERTPSFEPPTPWHAWTPYSYYMSEIPSWSGDVAALQHKLSWYNHWESMNKLSGPTFWTSVVALPILALTALGGTLCIAAAHHPRASASVVKWFRPNDNL